MGVILYVTLNQKERTKQDNISVTSVRWSGKHQVSWNNFAGSVKLVLELTPSLIGCFWTWLPVLCLRFIINVPLGSIYVFSAQQRDSVSLYVIHCGQTLVKDKLKFLSRADIDCVCACVCVNVNLRLVIAHLFFGLEPLILYWWLPHSIAAEAQVVARHKGYRLGLNEDLQSCAFRRFSL